MRTKSFIILLICAVMFAWAGNREPQLKKRHRNAVKDSVVQKDSANRSLLKAESATVDTTTMDSLQRAIYRHNKIVDDSIRLDSLNRTKKNGIDAPVNYEAQDSMVYDARTKTAYLYGTSEVKYTAMDLKSDRIRMSLDSSVVHATGTPDSTAKGGIKGRPIFTMGSDTYDTDTIAFNFKSKKGLVRNAYTKQQDGFLTSEISKRAENGDVYLAHGRYT